MLVFAGFYNYNMIRSVLFWANYVNIDLNKFVPTVYSGQVTGFISLGPKNLWSLWRPLRHTSIESLLKC